MSSTSNPKTFTLLLFASAQSYTGESWLTLPAPMSLTQLFPTLERMYPGITYQVLRSCAVSVNLEYVDIPGTEDEVDPSVEGGGRNGERSAEEMGHREIKEEGVIQPGDEVGIIPPVSSG